MALPVLAKVWQFNVNQTVAANASLLIQSQGVMFALKQSLKGFALFGWTVWGSCDGAGGVGSFGNGDAVDRWAAAANCIWATAGSNHSWIVLQQAGLSAKFAICIDLNFSAGTSGSATVMMSPSAGFGAANGGADGTATARPTATDEVQLVSGAWGVTSTANRQQRLHVMQSTDGECTRALIIGLNFNTGFWMFDRARAPSPLWAPANLGLVSGVASGANNGTYARLSDVAAPLVMFRQAPGAYSGGMVLTAQSVFTTGFLPNVHAYADDDTGLWPMFPLGLYSPNPPVRGFKGRVFDLWYGSSSRVNGDDYPGDASRQFVQASNLIFPWDGSVMATS